MSRPKQLRTALIYVFASMLAVIISSNVASTVIPPDLLTDNYLDCLTQLIQKQTASKHMLPVKLADLDLGEHSVNILNDGWQQPIKYKCNKDGTFELTSTGMTGPGSALTITCSVINPADDTMSDKMWDTLNRLEDLDRLVCKFIKSNHEIPAKLPDLPTPDRSSFEYKNDDAWGNTFRYIPDSSTGFELRTEFMLNENRYVFSRRSTGLIKDASTKPFN